MMVMDATLRVSRVVQVSFKPCAVFESYVGGPEGVGSMQQKGFLESIVRQRDPYLFFLPTATRTCSTDFPHTALIHCMIL